MKPSKTLHSTLQVTIERILPFTVANIFSPLDFSLKKYAPQVEHVETLKNFDLSLLSLFPVVNWSLNVKS